MTFASNGAAVLSELLRHLTGVHAGVERINREWERMRPLMAGALSVAAGSAALKAISDLVLKHRELNDELAKTKQLGDGSGGNFASRLPEERDAAIRAQQQVPTATYADLVKQLRELSVIIGSIDDAKAILPDAAKFDYVVRNFGGKGGEETLRDAIKVAENRGQIYTVGPDGKEHVDPAKLMAELNAMANGIRAAGGMLDTHDFLQFSRQAGLAGRAMDAQAFYALAAEAGQVMGASKAGTATTGLFQQLAGGTMTRRVADEMTRLHILGENEWHSDHGHITVDKSATDRLGKALGDPVKYITETLVPQLEAQGIKGKDALMEVFKLFGRQTVERLVGDIMEGSPQFDRTRKLLLQGQPTGDAYNSLIGENTTANLDALRASWTSLMQALSDAGAPLAISVLHGLTEAVQFLGKAAADHPHVAEWLLGIGGAISLLAVVGGGLAVLKISLWGLAGALDGLAASAAPFAAAGRALAGLLALTRALRGLALLGLTGPAGGEDPEFSRKKNEEFLNNHPSLRPRPENGGPGVAPAPAIPNMTVRPEKQSWLMDPVSQEGLARSIAEHIVAGLRGGGPLPVDVANAGEIGGAAGKAAASGTLSRVITMAGRPPTGPTGGDFRTAQSYPSRLAQA